MKHMFSNISVAFATESWHSFIKYTKFYHKIIFILFYSFLFNIFTHYNTKYFNNRNNY